MLFTVMKVDWKGHRVISSHHHRVFHQRLDRSFISSCRPSDICSTAKHTTVMGIFHRTPKMSASGEQSQGMKKSQRRNRMLRYFQPWTKWWTGTPTLQFLVPCCKLKPTTVDTLRVCILFLATTFTQVQATIWILARVIVITVIRDTVQLLFQQDSKCLQTILMTKLWTWLTAFCAHWSMVVESCSLHGRCFLYFIIIYIMLR